MTFAEFVSAEGLKEIMGSISDDINDLIRREEDVRKSLEALAGALKVDSKRRKDINEFYQARMKEFLANLDVNVLETRDYKTFEKQIKINALGSDLPRSLLAQYFAFLHTMEKFNPSIACPLVLDSPLQQEQDPDNINAIFHFILSKVLSDQQLILGTLTVDSAPAGVIPLGANTIHLMNKLQLLEPKQYDPAMDRIGKLHEIMLAPDG